MSKKDYIKVATIIKNRIEHNQNAIIPDTCRAECHIKEAQWIAEQLAEIFADDNPQFDYQRFYKACGIAD